MAGLAACSPDEAEAPPLFQASETPDRRFSPRQDDWPHSISDIAPDPRAKFGRLENGLRYVILPVPDENETVSIQLSVSAGFNDEPEGLYGIAHLLEHMAFRGARSENDGSIIHDLQSAGVKFGRDFNGFTSADSTYYIVNLPSNDRPDIDAALRNVSQLVLALNLTEDSLELEKKVVLAELKARNTLQRRSQQDFRQFKFPDRPREEFVGSGTEESLNAIRLSQVEAFYAAHYRPDNVLLVVTGDVKTMRIEKTIDRLFTGWSSDAANPRHDRVVAAPDFSQFPTTASFQEKHTKTQINAIENSPSTLRKHTAQIRQRSFSESIASTIFQRRLNKIIDADKSVSWITPFKSRYPQYDIRGFHSSAKDYSQMMTYFETERLRLIKYGFTQDEIDFAIESKRTRLENLAERPDFINAWSEANRLRNNFMDGKIYTSRAQELDAFEAFVEKNILEDFHSTAKDMWVDFKPRYWTKSSNSMAATLDKVIAVPEAVSTLDIEPSTIQSRSEFKLKAFPEAGAIASRDIASKNIHRLLYENGVRLNYQQRDQEPDGIQILVSIKGDLPDIIDRYSAISERLSAFSRADIKDATKEDIDSALVGQSANFYLNLLEGRLQIHSSTRPEDLETALNLLATYIIDVDLKSKYQKENIKSQTSKFNRALTASPLQAGIYKIHSAYSNKSPSFNARWAGFYPIESNIEKDIQKILDTGAIEVGIVGDFNPEVLESAFAESLGALPGRRMIEKAPIPQSEKATHKDPGLSSFTYPGTDEQMALLYCWPRPMPETIEDMMYWRMTDEIMRNRIVEKLREELGVIYSPTKLRYADPIFPNFQFSCFGVQIDPNVELKTHDGLSSLIDEAKTVPVEKTELNRAREPQRSLLKKYGDLNALLVLGVSRAYSQPERINEFREREQILKRISLNRLNETMTAFFDRSDLHIFRIQHFQGGNSTELAKWKVE